MTGLRGFIILEYLSSIVFIAKDLLVSLLLGLFSIFSQQLFPPDREAWKKVTWQKSVL
jgi:hypothetical protein